MAKGGKDKPKAKAPVPAVKRGLKTGGGATTDQAKKRIELGKKRDEYARAESGPATPRGEGGSRGSLPIFSVSQSTGASRNR